MNFMPPGSSSSSSGFYHHQDISSSSSPHNNHNNYPSPYHHHHHQQPYSSSIVADNSDEGTSSTAIEREHMFDKVVTPSDVGKLNRLVIPKQHAEKYFPLDSSAHEKGLLLNFEDRTGKPWRFRYSYWNSSQSYVMTKGWSRFVKEKKLDAGDIVSFQRGVGESAKDRLFIDWRRRPDAPEIHPPSLPSYPIRPPPWNSFYMTNPPSMAPPHTSSRSESFSRYFHPYTHQPQFGGGGGSGFNYGYNYQHSHRVVNGNPCGTGSIVYLQSSGMEAAGFNATMTTQLRAAPVQPEIGREVAVFNAVPIVEGKAAAKRLRLFGVNMDCPISDSEDCELEMASSNSTIPFSIADAAPEDYPSPSGHGSDKGKTTTSMSLDLDI